MASSIKAARNALYDVLAAWTGLSDVEVVWGAPQYHDPARTVALGGVTVESSDPSALGANRFRESYSLLVHCFAVEGGSGSQAAEAADQAGSDLAEQVRLAVLDSRQPPLGLTELHWALPGAWDTEGAVLTNDGWVMFITVPIHCQSTIT